MLKSDTEVGQLGVPQIIEQSSEEPSLSSRILGIDWRQHFPVHIGLDGISVHVSDYAEAHAFYRSHYREIYELENQSSLFLANEDKGESKTRYYRAAGDFFAFKTGEGRIVGIFVGTLIDWSSYYFRNCSILPEFQGRGLYQLLLGQLISVLEGSSVDRIEGDIAPSNLGHIHTLTKFGFNITGLNLSERWGSLLHFTKFISGKHHEVFLEQFCHGVRPEPRQPSNC